MSLEGLCSVPSMQGDCWVSHPCCCSGGAVLASAQPWSGGLCRGGRVSSCLLLRVEQERENGWFLALKARGRKPECWLDNAMRGHQKIRSWPL